MKTELEKKYAINLESITEKDIIYFCRDSLSLDIPQELKQVYEKEILDILKSKEYDWLAQDIDKNVILTYPVRNNAFSIVKYLIENNKYNLHEYNESLSGAVKACISLKGTDMCEYLLSNNLHEEYITDMTFQSLIMSDSVIAKYRTVYVEKAQRLMKLNPEFSTLLNKFLSMYPDDFKNVKLSFVKLLDSHPLSNLEKVNIIKPIIENGIDSSSKLIFLKLEKNRILDNWVRYVAMDNKYPLKNDNSKKAKI